MAAISPAEAPPRAVPHLRWRVVPLCFVAQNCAMGLAFGSFGPLLASTEQHFAISRTVASTGMSFIMLAIGGLSPLLGSLLQRTSVRLGMAAGAVLSAAGYWGLATLPSFTAALAMYLLIGTGVSLTAILGPLILISRWYDANRGRMLSLVNLPIALFVTPYLVASMLPEHGRLGVLGAMGTLFLILAPLLLLLDEHPPGPSPRSPRAPAIETAGADRPAAILAQPAFWLLSIGIGIMAGAGSSFMVHIVPFGTDRHLSLSAAAAVLSVYSGAGILGTLLFGWVADRIGPPRAVLISASCQAVLWGCLLQVNDTLLYLVAGLLGVCLVPLTTLHGANLGYIFGPERVGRATGYSYLVKLPFIFVFAPAIGWIFEQSRGYHLPFLLTAALMALSSLCFYLMWLTLGRRSKTPVSVKVATGRSS
jgi:MFS family permease